MISDTQQRLVKIRNKLKEEKNACELAYSSVLWPDNIPEASWSGAISTTYVQGVVARFRARFTRTDGNNGTPYVDFTQAVTFSPTYAQYTQSQGATVSGNDVGYVDDQNYTGYVADSGSNYVDYYIDFLDAFSFNYQNIASVNVTITVQAISMIKGQITITRLK